MSPFSTDQWKALQQLVVDSFALNSLSQLTRLRLGVRLDVVVNTNQAFGAVVLELLDKVESLGWTEEFVRAVYEEQKTNAAVVDFCNASATFVFTPRTSTNELARSVGSGLAAVVGRLAADGDAIRNVLVGQAHQNLSDLGTQFTRLRQYKTLHDCLHNLQFKYARLIRNGIKLIADSAEQADELMILFGEMADELAGSKSEADAVESRDAENVWLNVANESVRRMRLAVSGPIRDVKAANAGFALLEGVLRVQPTRINELLTGVLERLALDRLRSLLVDLSKRMGGEGDSLASAAAALGSLTPRLNRILCDHREWQLVDNTLLQIETEQRLGSPVEQCAFLWAEGDRVLEPILDRDRGAAWSDELRGLAAELTKAFESGSPEGVGTAFRRLRPRAMWFFFQADTELKELSGELDKLGGQLDVLLKEVGDDVKPGPA